MKGSSSAARQEAADIEKLKARIEPLEALSSRLSAAEVRIGAIAMRMGVGDGKDEMTQLRSLESRIERLEARPPPPQYRGIWREDDDHRVGDFVTHDGSIWHCWQNHTQDKPGTSTAWQLAVKRGKDAPR